MGGHRGRRAPETLNPYTLNSQPSTRPPTGWGDLGCRERLLYSEVVDERNRKGLSRQRMPLLARCHLLRKHLLRACRRAAIHAVVGAVLHLMRKSLRPFAQLAIFHACATREPCRCLPTSAIHFAPDSGDHSSYSSPHKTRQRLNKRMRTRTPQAKGGGPLRHCRRPHPHFRACV